MDERTEAMINGALMIIGVAAILDTMVVHWILGWHRLIEGMSDPELFLLELGIIFIGAILVAVGAWRE